MATFLAPLREPLLALLGALGGAAMAWAWFAGYGPAAIVCAVVVIGAGVYSQQHGASLLPWHPQRAVRYLDMAILVFVALTAVAAAAVIIVTVALTVGKDASTQTKEVMSALSAAVTTFIAATLVSTEKSDAAIGEYVQKHFYAAYDRLPKVDEHGQTEQRRYAVADDKKVLLLQDSAGESAIYSEGWSGLEGWGWKARRKRAQTLQVYLKSPALPEAAVSQTG